MIKFSKKVSRKFKHQACQPTEADGLQPTKFGTWPVQINYVTCLPFCMVIFKHLTSVIKRNVVNEESGVTS